MIKGLPTDSQTYGFVHRSLSKFQEKEEGCVKKIRQSKVIENPEFENKELKASVGNDNGILIKILNIKQL